uniref:Carboxylesterase type B domain-containing protein n=1 Tax=Anopheles farauti TaxID=69004 RepID=A0A182QX67_9DIPT
MDAVIGSEDCLFANIYAPLPFGLSTAAAPNLHPVLGILVVTFNYRLSMIGFLKSEEYNIRGNFGLKDQTMLLRWVNQYIRHFNGDPDRVTLVGHSSGAGAVTHHLYIPQSKHLFHRMIALSGSPLAPWSLLYNHDHCPDNYVNNLNITSEEDFFTKDFREFFIHNRENKYSFQFASSVLRERFTKFKVPILLSETRKEFETLTKFVDALRFFPNFPHDWAESRLSSFNSALEAFTASTVAAGQANNSSEVLQQIANFANLVYPVRRFAKDLIRVLDPATPVYYQRFEYDGRFGQAKHDYYRYFLHHSAYGAMHGDELGYIFSPYIVDKAFAEPEEYREEWTVHWRMVELVANFARYGNPTPTHITSNLNITWPAVNRDSSHLTYLNIDKTLELRSFEDNLSGTVRRTASVRCESDDTQAGLGRRMVVCDVTLASPGGVPGFGYHPGLHGPPEGLHCGSESVN